MSHITRIKTQIFEKEYLTQALTDLGYEWEAGDVKIKGFGGARRKVEIRVKTGVLSGDIGFIRSPDGGYDIVADWWGVRNTNKDKFLQQVTRRYAYHATRGKLEAQGFDLVTEEEQESGEIRMVLRRVARY